MGPMIECGECGQCTDVATVLVEAATAICKDSRKQAIDECIRVLQNDLPRGEIETEAANLYTGGMHRAIYVLGRLKSEGEGWFFLRDQK